MPFESYGLARATIKSDTDKLYSIARSLWTQNINPAGVGMYKQTGNSLSAIAKLDIDHIMFADPNFETIESGITWLNPLAWHPSILGGGQPKGHAIWLMSEGWHATKLERSLGRKINKFTYYSGSGYLSKLVSDFNRVKDSRVSIKIEKRF